MELFDTDNFFNAEKIVCPVGKTEHILTDEQKQFQEDMKDPEKYKAWQEKLKEDILEAERKAEEEGRVHYFNREEIENTA